MQPEPQNSKPNSPADFSERLRIRAAANPIAKTKPVLRLIIEARHVLAELRAEGRTSEDIRELLEAENIHTTAGTIRNVRTQISRAIEALELEGNGKPTDDQIHEMVIRLAAAASGGKPHKKLTQENTSQRHVQAQSPTSLETTRQRNSAEEDDLRAHNLGTFKIKSDRENL
jgi:hypothetical protein